MAPIASEDKPGETIDVTIARTIGRSSRFPTVMVTANGDMRTSFSYENANSVNAAEPSPLNLYTRIFGPGYQDPNAEGFTPSPLVMVRKSVLSGVLDQTRELEKVVGAEDRARLDQYFTGLRDLERQFDQQLTKPEPIAACHAVSPPGQDPRPGIDADIVAQASSPADRSDGDGARLRPDPRVQHGLFRGLRLDHQAGLRKTTPHDDA
jgi:hypothetical protein